MPEVPCHEEFNTIRDGDCNMCSILGCLAWNRAEVDQGLCEPFGIRGGIEKRDGRERFEPDVRGLGIAGSGFGNDQLRCRQLEPVRRIAPPFARKFLVGRNHDITGRARREVAYDRSLDVRDGLHRNGLTIQRGRIAQTRYS